MDVKGMLKSYIPAHKYALLCARDLDALLETVVKSPAMDGMPRKPATNGLEYEVARIEIAKVKLEKARNKALRLQDEIEDMIDLLTDSDQKSLIRLRYIHGLSWDEVASEMNWSRSQVFRIHGWALENLRRMT